MSEFLVHVNRFLIQENRDYHIKITLFLLSHIGDIKKKYIFPPLLSLVQVVSVLNYNTITATKSVRVFQIEKRIRVS